MPYHVRITPKGGGSDRRDATARDKDADWIEENIAAPRRAGRGIFVGGRVFSWDEIDQISIAETSEPTGSLSVADVFRDGVDVTERFLSGLPGGASRAGSDAKISVNRKAVMVIYGHDTEANDALFDWLRAIGLHPRQWNQLISASGAASPYIGQVLDRAFEQAQAVIAFFTPDERVTGNDPARAGQGWRLQARPNVLIEAGMALVTHPDRTVLVVLGDQELPSDLAGRHHVRIQGKDQSSSLHDLATRLQSAGCDTDLTGGDWLRQDRFPGRDQAAAGQSAPSPSATSASAKPGTKRQTSPMPPLVQTTGTASAPRSQGRHAASSQASTAGPKGPAQPTAAPGWLQPSSLEPQGQGRPAARPGPRSSGQPPSANWPEPAILEPAQRGEPPAGPGWTGPAPAAPAQDGDIPDWLRSVLSEPLVQDGPVASPGQERYGRLPNANGPEPAIPGPADHDKPGTASWPPPGTVWPEFPRAASEQQDQD